MPLTVAVQMDPIERIRIAGNSTFALLLEAQARGHALLYYTPDRLCLEGATLVAQAQPLSVKDTQGEHASLGEARRVDLAEVDVVLLRQDPPFDLAYVTTTHLLERIHPRTLVVNNPRAVRDAPEKLFVMDFPELMPPTLISRDRAAIEAFRARARRSGDEAALRRRRRGGVQDRGQGSEFRLAVRPLFRHLPRTLGHPEIPAGGRHGDKRIILVDGEPLGAVNRVPVGDDIRSNMVRGGAAQETELTPREREICAAIGPELKRRGLIFVGIDVIDGHLTEINVTSPTGLRAIRRFGGPDLAAAIWDVIEAKRRAFAPHASDLAASG